MALLNNFDVQLARYDRMINHTDLNDSMSTYDTVLRLAGDYTSENLQTATALASGPTHDGDLNASLAKQLRIFFCLLMLPVATPRGARSSTGSLPGT